MMVFLNYVGKKLFKVHSIFEFILFDFRGTTVDWENEKTVIIIITIH